VNDVPFCTLKVMKSGEESCHSSHFPAEYPKRMENDATISNFAVGNRENGLRLDNLNKSDCTQLAPSLQRQKNDKEFQDTI
jgi:hypothetical protein